MLTWPTDQFTPLSVVVLGACATFLVIFLVAGLEKRDGNSQKRFWSWRTKGVVALLCSLFVGISVFALDRFNQEQLNESKTEPEIGNQPRYLPLGTPDAPVAIVKGSAVEGGRFEPGTEVPDFVLPDVQSGDGVRFSQFRANRPTVLILGSFGCNLFCYQLTQLKQLYKDFHKKAAFLFVKVKDAGHPLPPDLLKAFEDNDMKAETRSNRLSRTSLSVKVMDFPGPCVLDDEERHVEKLYGAFPKRLMIVDAHGRVVLDVGKGMGKVKETDTYGGWDFTAIKSCLYNLP